MLLQASKSRPEDVSAIASTCFKLNSIQLRTILHLYSPTADEADVNRGLADGVVAVAERTADELTKNDGGKVRLDEEYRLSSPFVIPDDGYTSDVVTGMPAGLADYLEPACRQGIIFSPLVAVPCGRLGTILPSLSLTIIVIAFRPCFASAFRLMQINGLFDVVRHLGSAESRRRRRQRS